MSKLSVIIVTYNSADLISNCLNSVVQSVSKYRPEIFVIDNNSADDTVKVVRENFPQVKLFANQINQGFAVAANQGIKAAKGEYVFFLNPDAILLPHTLERLVAWLKKNKTTGFVGAQLIGLNRLPQPSFGKFISYWTEFWHMTYLFKYLPYGSYFPYGWWNKGKYLPGRVDWVSGGAMLTRSSLLKKLKGFDEKFFMYYEDMDLCLRGKKLGYSAYYLPQAKVIHVQMASWRGEKGKAWFFSSQSFVYYFRKHRKSVLVAKFYLALRETIKWVFVRSQ